MPSQRESRGDERALPTVFSDASFLPFPMGEAVRRSHDGEG